MRVNALVYIQFLEKTGRAIEGYNIFIPFQLKIYKQFFRFYFIFKSGSIFIPNLWIHEHIKVRLLILLLDIILIIISLIFL